MNIEHFESYERTIKISFVVINVIARKYIRTQMRARSLLSSLWIALHIGRVRENENTPSSRDALFTEKKKRK